MEYELTIIINDKTFKELKIEKEALEVEMGVGVIISEYQDKNEIIFWKTEELKDKGMLKLN